MVNRDNQQQTATPAELGWLGGIIEGEGCICLQIHKRNSRTQTLCVTPKVIITNSDELLIEKCIEILSKIGVGKYVLHTRPNKGSFTNATKDMTYIHISGMKRIRKLLGSLEKSLHGEKKERLKRLKYLVDRRLEKSQEKKKKMNYNYDQEDIDNMLSFLELTKRKNRKNVSRMLNDYMQGRTRGKWVRKI